MLESNEVISKGDAEIRRLVEERRTTPIEEEQRLKEVSKQKCIRTKKSKKKKREEIQQMLEDFKEIKNIHLITKRKKERRSHHVKKGNCQSMFLEKSTASYRMTINMMKQRWIPT